MDETTRAALQTIAASHRSLAESLERILQDQLPHAADADDTPELSVQMQGDQALRTWDPETDEPLVRPRVVGTREEQDWCTLTYLGGIYAINRRYGRGANAAEIRDFAIKAGYQDGRAVTAWSKGNGPTFNDENKQRWIKAEAVDNWVKRLAGKHGVALPEDLAAPWTPDERG